MLRASLCTGQLSKAQGGCCIYVLAIAELGFETLLSIMIRFGLNVEVKCSLNIQTLLLQKETNIKILHIMQVRM
jgi:hypothetical protein